MHFPEKSVSLMSDGSLHTVGNSAGYGFVPMQIHILRPTPQNVIVSGHGALGSSLGFHESESEDLMLGLAP